MKNIKNLVYYIISGIVLAAIIMLSILWILGENTEFQIKRALEGQYAKSQFALVADIAASIGSDLDNFEKELKLIAQLPSISSGDTDSCNHMMRVIHETLDLQLSNIGRVGSDGIIYCALIESSIGINAIEEESVQKLFDDPNHSTTLSRVIKYKYEDGERVLVTMNVPVFNEDGEFDGSVGGAIWLKDVYGAYLGGVQTVPGSYMALLDDNGDILYHPSSDFIGANEQDTIIQDLYLENMNLEDFLLSSIQGDVGTKAYNYNGDLKIGAYYPVSILPDRYWSVALTAPVSGVQGVIIPIASRLQVQVLYIVGMIILATLGFILVLFEWNRQLNRRILERTKEIAEKNRKLKQAVSKYEQSIEELRSLNKVMVGRELRIKELKNKIIELKRGSR